jgi:Anti-sigma factor NepR
MSKEVSPRRGAGRLSRKDQGRLGDLLKQVYEDVVREGIPERFQNLLNELKVPDTKGPAAELAQPKSSEAEPAEGLGNGARGKPVEAPIVRTAGRE